MTVEAAADGGDRAPGGDTRALGPVAEGHTGACRCGRCPHGARTRHREAVAAFIALRDRYAAGHGVPAGLARSAGAARQWISDELALAARTVAERRAATEDAWRDSVRRATLIALGLGVGALLLGQALTAIGSGWTAHRTATLLATALMAAALAVVAVRHRAQGGVLAPLIGEDRRLSTSRTVAALWALIVVHAALTAAGRRVLDGPGAADGARGGALWSDAVPLLVVLVAVGGAAVLARVVVGVRISTGRLQKLAAERPRAVDLVADDAGRGSLADAQYVGVNAAVMLSALLTKGVPALPALQVPSLSWVLCCLVLVSAAGYLTGKVVEGGRPVILSVVRARELGDLAAPIRTGDDIEIRGSGFLPPGARTPDRLARTVVRIGAVHVPVPLIPVAGGFANPSDGALIVPVPVDVEPGRVEVRVITAAGAETNGYTIEVQD